MRERQIRRNTGVGESEDTGVGERKIGRATGVVQAERETGIGETEKKRGKERQER